jgi:erythromycin esterase-like protein
MRYFTMLAANLALASCATSSPRDPALQPIAATLCSKDIVLLGELPSHGEAKTFGLKAAIVQDLVQSCGFDAVLFEAPIYDFIGFQNAVQQRTATATQLDNAIGRFWLTRELGPFRAWLFEQVNRGDLLVGGVDDQVSITSQYARARLPELVHAECRATVRRNLEWTYNDAQPFNDSEKAGLRTCAYSPPANDPLLRNLHTYVERQTNDKAARTRDDVMAENVEWYRSRMPKGSKVIVWTATTHAARTQGDLSTKPLGAFLAESHKARVAAVGFTALRGESSMAARPAKPLPDLPASSLETRTLSGDVAWMFLDNKQLQQLGKLPSRLFGRVTEANWSEHFDGVVVIRDEVAPTFDPWK